MKRLTGDELTTVYPDLFEKIFGYRPDKQIPKFVIVDDKVEGFVSGYLIDKETFYWSWVGHLKGMLGVRRTFNEIERLLQESGVKWIVGRVHNTNTVTQRLMLGLGWYPRGMSQTITGLHIEYIKEL